MSAFDPKDPEGMQAKKILAQLDDPAFAAFRSQIDDPAFAAFRSQPTTLSQQITARTTPPVLSLDRNNEGYWLHVDAPNGLKADFHLLAGTFKRRIVGRALQSALEAQKP